MTPFAIKPTVIPFALIGIRDRRWWLCLVALAVLSFPFLTDTLRYPQVLLNAQTNPVDGRGGDVGLAGRYSAPGKAKPRPEIVEAAGW